MASSVSSERAFSSAGITICKRCNRLDGDIVEALQCLKALLHQDITLRYIPSVADEELHLDNANMQSVNHEGPASEVVEGAEEWTWDEIGEDHGNGSGDGNESDDDVEATG
jgi:hypothetical protein